MCQVGRDPEGPGEEHTSLPHLPGLTPWTPGGYVSPQLSSCAQGVWDYLLLYYTGLPENTWMCVATFSF